MGFILEHQSEQCLKRGGFLSPYASFLCERVLGDMKEENNRYTTQHSESNTNTLTKGFLSKFPLTLK